MNNELTTEPSSAESSPSQRAENIRIIKERPPEILHENLQRNLKVLVDYYLSEQKKSGPAFLKNLFEMRNKRKLSQKIEKFSAFFEKEVFEKIYHWSSTLVSDNVLKSPEMLAKETGRSSLVTGLHSGPLDREIGNTQYVFANADSLKSRSALGKYAFQISSTEGYVVPLDIAVIKSPTHLEGKQLEQYVLDVYSKNLYTITDFKVFFATYCAVLFDQPSDAITFFDGNSFWPDLANCWEDTQMDGQEKTDILKRKMRDLVVKAKIEPPVSPEFQFKDKVVAKLKEED